MPLISQPTMKSNSIDALCYVDEEKKNNIFAAFKNVFQEVDVVLMFAKIVIT